LAVHRLLRNRKPSEDFPYAKWRREWGRRFVLRSYLQVFLLHAALLRFKGDPSNKGRIISPALITFMLLRVSGVTMLEKKYAGNPEFEDCARRTSAFVPWFPKNRSAAR
jgi:steroid 5-alpha reductase family enzyme